MNESADENCSENDGVGRTVRVGGETRCWGRRTRGGEGGGMIF